MLVVGLTGGIASGKSVVSKMLKELGAWVIDADDVSREVMLPHTKCWEQVVASFGKEILKEDLTIDRKMLSDRVFNNCEQLSKLNSISHPEIAKRVEEHLEAIKGKDPQAIVIVDAALLVEAGMYKSYDKLIVVSASNETQLKRIMVRDGLSQEEAQKRINSQLSLKEKVRLADFVIENEGSLENIEDEVKKVFQALERCSESKWDRT